MNGIERLSKEIAKATKGSKTKPYDTKGIVRSVKDGKAMVHFYGGVDETPVDLTINAKVGDEVVVRVSGGRAFIVGNDSAPPTDDTKAEQVERKLDRATEIIDGDLRRVYKGVGDLNTLVRESADGVEVGKVNSQGEYVAGHTLISAEENEYQVIDKDGNIVASFGAESEIRTSDGELLAKFGYSQKEQDDGTTAIAPFYLFGKGLEVSRTYGFAVGKYNLDGDYLFSVGRGTSSRRKNAFAVAPDGIIEINGKTVNPLSEDLDSYIGSEFTGSTSDEYAPPSISIMRWGNVVELRGCVYPKATITGGVSQHTICTIPSGLGLRPSVREVVEVMQGSGQMHWCLRVKPDGTVTFSRAVNGGAYVNVDASTWLPFHATWITTYI